MMKMIVNMQTPFPPGWEEMTLWSPPSLWFVKPLLVESRKILPGDGGGNINNDDDDDDDDDFKLVSGKILWRPS